MSEEVKLGAHLFGYDTLLKAGSSFVALRGEDAPELTTGMKVTLLGDSRGYVPSGFTPGEEVTITEFREAFKQGTSDHVICVTNGANTGWVKPSNIQRNLSRSGPEDPTYREVRRAVHRAFANFMDLVYLHMSDAERERLPQDTFSFVNEIVSYALERLPEFGEQLANTIAEVYEQSPEAQRFIQDPVRTNRVSRGLLFLDQDGHLVSIKNPEIVLSASTPAYRELKGYESYEVLTGPLRGRRFYPDTRPLNRPVYHPGVITGDSATGSRPSFDAVSAGDRIKDKSGVDPLRDTRSSSDSPRNRGGIFISYSHKDKKWLERVQVHLKPLERLGVTRFDDTLIKPGSKWREEIRVAIKSARVAILLVSADFLASDFIESDELPPLLAAAKADGAVIIPVIVSPCRFAETKSLSQFQALNSPARPLSNLTKTQREAELVKLVNAVEAELSN